MHPRCHPGFAGGHIVHLGSALGQLDALPLAQYKESIRDAKSIQELMDLRYPADEIAKVCGNTRSHMHRIRPTRLSGFAACTVLST